MTIRILIILTFLTLITAGSLLADEKAARNLILSQGCKACHTFEGDGGSLGPPLDRIGEKLTEGQLRQKLLYPKKSTPESVMPSFEHLTEDELQALVSFLAGQVKRK
jgi:cbb3-type cytochrome oxidase cytochrome c subunit